MRREETLNDMFRLQKLLRDLKRRPKAIMLHFIIQIVIPAGPGVPALCKEDFIQSLLKLQTNTCEELVKREH